MATLQQYTSLLQSLLPAGIAWTREEGSKLQRLLSAMATELLRIDDRAAALLLESDPRRASEMLPDWERITVANDSCRSGANTIAERRAAVVARLSSVGGQSIAYFTQLAAQIGFEITITEFKSFRAGLSRAGDAVYPVEYALTWRVNAPKETVTYARVGETVVGEKLADWGNERLECEINRVKPAHTILLFGYNS